MQAEGAAASVACREIFDENSQPSLEEITDYAHQIGIDPLSESHLLPLAKDGLMQALPAPWKAYFDEKLDTHYYYNPETKKTQWEHPLDKVYKDMVVKARTASEKDNSVHDDTCASVQELLTFEENSKQTEKVEAKVESPDEDFSTDSSDEPSKTNLKNKPDSPQFKKPLPKRPSVLTGNKPLSSLNPLGINERKLSDLRSSPLIRSVDSSFPVKSIALKDPFRSKFDGNSEFSIPGSKLQNPFEKPPLFKQQSEIIDLSIRLGDRHEDIGFNPLQPLRSDKGISFSGKGTIFLKSKRAELPSPDTDKSFPLDGSTKSEVPKGILREKTFDMLERKAESQKQELKQQGLSDDDKKSVRFNLEQKEAELPHEFSLSPSSNSSSDQLDKQSSIISNIGTTPKPLDVASAKISNENLAELPPRPVRTLKLAPIGKPELKNLTVDLPKQPPLRQMWGKQHTLDMEDKFESHSQVSTDRSDSRRESIPSPQGKRLLKPPAGDFIKPNLFQKQFDKIADIIKPISLDTDSESEFKSRPRSPMIPQKNKISINLMESIESETSIDSPDKEFPNMDLNDISEPIQTKSEKPKLSLKLNDNKISSPIHSPTLRTSHEKKARILQMEANLEAELKKISLELIEKRNTEERRLRDEMEASLKKLKEDIYKEQEVETDKLKARLKEQHENHKMEIEKAILNAQEQHKLSLKHVLENIQLKLQGEREDAIRKERERQREQIDDIISNMEREHNENVLRLHDEKAEELVKIRQKLDLENQRAIRETRELLLGTAEVERARQLSENKTALEKLKSDHDALCDEMRKDYRSEVELLRSQHNCHLAELRSRLAGEREAERRRKAAPDEDVARLTQEKRQLEDKYRCLKEKYARLKNDVKMSIERRNKRREQSMTTGSETEKSNSNKAAQANGRSKELHDPSMGMSTKSEPITATRATNNNPIIKYLNDNTKKSPNNNNSSDVDIKDRPSKMHLTVTSKNGNLSDLSSDLSRSKSPNIRDKSPIGKLKAENDKYKNSTDNELSMVNDTSLSQSDSHTVSKGKNKLTVAFSSDVDRNVPKKEKHVKKTHAQVYTDKAATDYHDSSDTANSLEKKPKESSHGRSRKKSFTRLKSASTSRLNYSPKRGDRSCSPVENLRQQLRKLEDLEDQFPDLTLNVDSAGYRLRYPFADLGVVDRGVPELEFVAHRALVEREGVRRARASLRRRRAALRDRRRRLSTATNLPADHAWQEERDLTDLEVSLHRTRALLGEKVIRLRHIENTLRTMANGSSDDTSPDKLDKADNVVRKDNKQDATLSDISSQSSGFSSTEVQSDTNIRHVLKREVSGVAIYEQSTEIINSLENLNTEIRDIWQVLNIQQRQNITKVIPPGQVLYSDLNFPIMGLSSMTAPQRVPATPSIPGMTVPITTATETMAAMGGHNLPDLHNIPTLADRLQTYRQMTNSRPSGMATVVTTAGATVHSGVATSLVERTKDLRDWLKHQASL